MNLRAAASSLAKSSIKATAGARDKVRPPTPGVTILIYHRVGAGGGGEMDLEPSVFDDQLAWLSSEREVVSIDEALRRLADPGGPNGDEVVITFDDGTADWVRHVLPSLERYSVPATFYVATSFLEGGLDVPELDREALRELAQSPLVSIGSHTHNHKLLDRLDTERLDDELDRSIDIIGEVTGDAPKHFAYPKAVAGSPEARSAVQDRFDSAVVAGTRANPAGADRFLLARSPIQASDTPRWFRAKATGGMRAEDDLRQLANRIRYRKLDS